MRAAPTPAACLTPSPARGPCGWEPAGPRACSHAGLSCFPATPRLASCHQVFPATHSDHACTHSHTHVHTMHICAYTVSHTYTTNILSHTITFTCAYICTNTRMHILMRARARTWSPILTHAHTSTHTPIHMHTHTHAHTPPRHLCWSRAPAEPQLQGPAK